MLLELIKRWMWRRDVAGVLRASGRKWFRFVDYPSPVSDDRIVGVCLSGPTGLRHGELNAFYRPGDLASLDVARRQVLMMTINVCCLEPKPG